MHSQQPPGVVQNWSTLQCSKQNTEQCGYDHAPVTRGRMRAQFPLPHGPSALECSGLNVKQHYILVIEYLYFENLCVSRNANNGIYLKYTPCFCRLPPGGFGYPKNNTPFHILFPSLQHGLPWAIAPGGGWATCDA